MERQFDPWQQEAIAIRGGRHLVLAPPGCGKTDILTERVVHAHEQGVEYKDMLKETHKQPLQHGPDASPSLIESISQFIGI